MSEGHDSMTTERAMLQLRADPVQLPRMIDAYLGPDLTENGERFWKSAEFAEARRMLGKRLGNATVLDVGAGNGIASYALAKAGAKRVYALEPDPSDEIGAGAIRRLCVGLPVEVIETVGERIPLADGSVDILYVRQVLHHIHDLPPALREFARVIRPGGVLLACRDHVVNDDSQMREFLANHPVHQLAGNEHAHSLDAYAAAIRGAGLRIERIMGPYDSVINAYPGLATQDEVERSPADVLKRKLGALGAACAAIAPIKSAMRGRMNRNAGPGRMYSFLATKPG